MKRILYVFALLVASAFAAEAQQRVIIGTGDLNNVSEINQRNLGLSKFESVTQQPYIDYSNREIPEFLVTEILNIGFSTRVHPFPENANTVDTARVLPSKTTQDVVYIGDMSVPVTISRGTPQEYIVNGFAQFVPFSFYAPELQNGTLRVDTLMFSIYPAGGPDNPVNGGVELWIVSAPNNYGTPGYQGVNFDLFNLPTENYLTDGPLLTISADSINAHVTAGSQPGSFSITRTVLDLAEMQKSFTVPTDKMWGMLFVKQNVADTVDQIGLIGAHEWTLQNNQTFGGIISHNKDKNTDTVRTLWSAPLGRTLNATEYPAYQNQRLKMNFNIIIFGEYNGEVDTTGGTGITPISKEAGFTLEQNIPNPVVDQSTIQFSVANYSNVSLRVYNALGQEVAELANGSFDAGTWEADFSTKNLPAGSYVYVLNANGQTLTRTLQVVR